MQRANPLLLRYRRFSAITIVSATAYQCLPRLMVSRTPDQPDLLGPADVQPRINLGGDLPFNSWLRRCQACSLSRNSGNIRFNPFRRLGNAQFLAPMTLPLAVCSAA